MLTTTTLDQSPRFVDFIEQLRQAEDPSARHVVTALDLELNQQERLVIKDKALNGEFAITDNAKGDLARLAKIPEQYFYDCEPDLQAYSFNRRLRRKIPTEEPLQLLMKEDIIDRVLNCNLLPVPRVPVLDTISKATPENLVREDLRLITHKWNGEIDISIIAPTLQCSPRKGDVVAFGLSVSENHRGALQVQGAAYRCICSNGAINRICDGREHRLRRPVNWANNQVSFLEKVASFARQAWDHWSDYADGLVDLRKTSLGPDQQGALESRLRQRPFFLSSGLVRQVMSRLQVETQNNDDSPSLYDLYNAMTFIGTHQTKLSTTYRTRLRLGAGEFTRRSSRFCEACSQFVLPGKRPNSRSVLSSGN